MAAISWAAVRIVDAAVQIDDDIWLLIILLILLNAAIGSLSYLLYKGTSPGRN